MEDLVRYYFTKGLATSTQRTYKSAQDRFLQFCQARGFPPIPVSQSLLCMYVSYLAEQKLKHRSIIKVYSQFANSIRSIHRCRNASIGPSIEGD